MEGGREDYDGANEGAKHMMQALKSGKFTDAVFLVGPEGGEQKEVHVVKSTMSMMSPFVERLLNGPLGPPAMPIKLENVDPKIFELITEYAHTYCLITPVECEDIVDLAIASDSLLIEPLLRLCAVLINEKARVDNVWTVLNKLLKHGLTRLTLVADGAKDVLCNSTMECLTHQSFLSAESHSLLYMLNQECLAGVHSELQLIEYCLRWAEGQPDKWLAFGELRPGLRLLTLSQTELCRLPKGVLLVDECENIFKYTITKEVPEGLSADTCLILKPRNFVCPESLRMKEIFGNLKEHYLEFIPDSFHNQPITLTNENEISSVDDISGVTNRLSLKTNASIYLTQIHFISFLQLLPDLAYDKEKGTYSPMPIKSESYNARITIDWENSVLNEMAYSQPCCALYNSTGSLRLLKSAFILKGKRLTVDITMFASQGEGDALIRRITLDDVNKAIEAKFKDNSQNPGIQFASLTGKPVRDLTDLRDDVWNRITARMFVKGISYIVMSRK